MSVQPLPVDTPLEKAKQSGTKVIVASGVSPEEYLRREALAKTRHEYYNGDIVAMNQYYDGEIVAMAGASTTHNLLTLNTAALLWIARRGSSCRVFSNDLKVRVAAADRFYYPDVVVVCGEQDPGEDEANGMTESPVLIVEVLSPSTEANDRGERFHHYRQIPTLREYVLVAQDRVSVERYVRHENTDLWTYSQVTGREAVVTLESLGENGVIVPLAEMYENVSPAK